MVFLALAAEMAFLMFRLAAWVCFLVAMVDLLAGVDV
jgi:hypothetical protein